MICAYISKIVTKTFLFIGKHMKPAWLESLIKMQDRSLASIKLAETFMKASSQERAVIIAGWDFNVEWQYPSPCRLACMQGELATPKERIIASLILFALDSYYEYYDQILFLSIVHHSCYIAGLDPHEIFAEVATALKIPAASIMLAFDARDESQKSMQEFMLVPIQSIAGETEIHIKPSYID